MAKVKICGLNTEAALDAALDAGADFVGFVLFEKSPRHVDTATARALIRRVRERGAAKAVVLAVDPDDALVESIARDLKPDIIQLHGHESVERVGTIVAATGLEVWKAVPVAASADAEAAGRYFDPGRFADLILFDAKPPADPASLPGGNGLTFDWRMLEPIKGRFPFALAGGLTPANVADAVRLVAPEILDVSSGVEERPGVKSVELIRRFLKAAKGGKG